MGEIRRAEGGPPALSAEAVERGRAAALVLGLAKQAEVSALVSLSEMVQTSAGLRERLENEMEMFLSADRVQDGIDREHRIKRASLTDAWAKLAHVELGAIDRILAVVKEMGSGADGNGEERALSAKAKERLSASRDRLKERAREEGVATGGEHGAGD